MAWVNNLDGLYDFIGYVVLRAPDKFPKEDYLKPDDQMTLDRAFSELRAGLNFVEADVTGVETKRRLASLLDEAHAAYISGERKKGAHLLQDFEALIFKK